jgi:hypothetical protein
VVEAAVGEVGAAVAVGAAAGVAAAGVAAGVAAAAGAAAAAVAGVAAAAAATDMPNSVVRLSLSSLAFESAQHNRLVPTFGRRIHRARRRDVGNRISTYTVDLCRYLLESVPGHLKKVIHNHILSRPVDRRALKIF